MCWDIAFHPPPLKASPTGSPPQPAASQPKKSESEYSALTTLATRGAVPFATGGRVGGGHEVAASGEEFVAINQMIAPREMAPTARRAGSRFTMAGGVRGKERVG
jgi:hypothetical protein